MLTDRGLITDVLDGRTQAFRLLVERHQGPVLGLVRSFVRDEQQAEDLAQDAFLSAFARLQDFNAARGSFRAWLLQIARNKCRDALRRKRPRLVAGRVAVPAAAHDPRAPDEALRRRLDEALRHLPPEQRVAFLLADVFGMRLEEIASIEAVPVGTVKSRASRARAHLRSLLQPCLEEPR